MGQAGSRSGDGRPERIERMHLSLSKKPVEMTSGDRLVERIEDKLQSLNPRDSTTFTIFRVPLAIRDIDPEAYKPQTISIGPYHHQHGQGSKPHLEKMEENKWVYFKHFLSRRSESSTHSVAGYVGIAKAWEQQWRSCYSEEISFGSDEFNLMMVLDACFLIELFLRGNMYVKKRGRHALEKRKDPIYSRDMVEQGVCRDLLLLENQIPFFILNDIYDTYLGSSPRRCSRSKLVNIASEYFNEHMKTDQKATQVLQHNYQIWHLLHLVYLLHKPHEVSITIHEPRPSRELQPLPSPPQPPTVEFPPASRLHEAGIKFQRRNEGNFPEISFENGVLKIPHLFIEESTESFIRNLVAFEQCLPRFHAYFTPYTVFMDYLINTPKDVEILCKNKIIRHELGSDEDVVSLFNKMGQGIVVGDYDNYLTKAFREVDECRRRKIPKWWALLRHYYFRNPWLVVSFVAAVVLLVCTVIQTVCSVVQVI